MPMDIDAYGEHLMNHASYGLGLSQYSKLAYCILHARCSQYIAALQYTDVVIIKPVTGRASIRSASLKTTRRLTP